MASAILLTTIRYDAHSAAVRARDPLQAVDFRVSMTDPIKERS
jgi:hypothetical protein